MTDDVELPMRCNPVIENYAKPQMFRRIRNFSAPHSLRSLRCSIPLCSYLRLGSYNRHISGYGYAPPKLLPSVATS